MTFTIELGTLIHVVKALHTDGDDLTRVSDAVLVGRGLNAQADALVSHFVDKARAGGATWSSVGEALGVTKQAAQKRYVETSRVPGAFAPWDKALTAAIVKASKQTPQELPCIGVRDLVLGLFADEAGPAATAANALGIELAGLRCCQDARRRRKGQSLGRGRSRGSQPSPRRDGGS